jgi:hypothetical protein
MSNHFLLRLLSRVQNVETGKAGLRQAEVVTVSPLTVSIGGGTAVSATALDGQHLEVNDKVTVMVQNHEITVAGMNTTNPTLEGDMVACSSSLTTGTSFSDVTGLTYTTDRAGTFLVNVSLDVGCTGTGTFIGILVVDGVAETATIVAAATAGDRGAHSKTYRVTAAAGDIIKVQALRAGGGSGFTVQLTNSTMTIQRLP